MPSIKTNLLRIQLSQIYHSYSIQVNSNCDLEHQQIHIKQHLTQTFPLSIISLPLLLSSTPIQLSQLYSHLPNGQPIKIKIQPIHNVDYGTMLQALPQELLQRTQLMYCGELKLALNPFEEFMVSGGNGEKKRVIPGCQVRIVQGGNCLYIGICAVDLVLQSNTVLSQHQSNVLMDYHTGKFYKREDIVRIDKEQGKVIFRNGQKTNRNALQPVQPKYVNGFILAQRINDFVKRLKNTQTTIQFCQAWGLKLDSRFVQSKYEYVPVGTLGFRQNIDKSLSQLVTPMSSHNYSNNYLRFFGSVVFEDHLKAAITILVPTQMQEQSAMLLKYLERIGVRMKMELKTKIIAYKEVGHLLELVAVVYKNQQAQQQGQVGAGEEHKMCILMLPNNAEQEKDTLQKVTQSMVNLNMYFHLLPASSVKLDKQHMQILTYRSLATIYTKFRLNPWKPKSLPFMSQPMMLITLHIQPTRLPNTYSLSLVGTMNLFFTKFTAVTAHSSLSSISQNVAILLRQCLNHFKSKHQRYPQRVFLVRNDGEVQKVRIEIQVVQHVAGEMGALLTYVTLWDGHGVQLYNQLDSNFISKQTTKKPQMLLHTTINNQNYVQLQMERPPHMVSIDPLQPKDPNFIAKVIELVSKTAMAGVGHRYGEGLGIIDYARLLNQYRDYDLTHWRAKLLDGILMFL